MYASDFATREWPWTSKDCLARRNWSQTHVAILLAHVEPSRHGFVEDFTDRQEYVYAAGS